MLGMVVTWRVLPVEHHAVVETPEVTELHLVGFDEICVEPVQEPIRGPLLGTTPFPPEENIKNREDFIN